MSVKQTQPSVRQQAAMWLMIIKQLAASYVWTAIGVSVLIGLILGLIVAWGIWPVNWTGAKPSSLSNNPDKGQTYMWSYLNFAATTYGTGSMSLDDTAKYLGEGWTVQDVTAVLQKMIDANYAGNVGNLTKLKNDLTVFGQSGKQLGPPGASSSQAGISAVVPLIIVGLFLILFLFITVWLIRRLRSEKPRQAPTAPSTRAAVSGEQAVIDTGAVVVPSVSRAVGGARPVEKTAWPGETRAPLTQFATTYAFGDDRYDMSSSIETSGGDFLGECGVGISETIGAGAPEKVTALEVWVFDKNDVRTVTKVLMSDYAFNDAALRAKLAPKGDAILARPGEVVELKTQTLKINARIVDVAYGSSTPANSYFQQVTLELATWSDSAS